MLYLLEDRGRSSTYAEILPRSWLYSEHNRTGRVVEEFHVTQAVQKAKKTNILIVVPTNGAVHDLEQKLRQTIPIWKE